MRIFLDSVAVTEISETERGSSRRISSKSFLRSIFGLGEAGRVSCREAEPGRHASLHTSQSTSAVMEILEGSAWPEGGVS